MFSRIGAPELLVVLLIIVLVFGAANLPKLARALGQSARILRDETKGLRESDDKDAAKAAAGVDPAVLESTQADKDRLAELDRREAEIKAERERLSGSN